MTKTFYFQQLRIPTSPITKYALRSTFFAQEAHSPAQGELTIIIREPIKSISKSEALSSILGYTVGNDLTARLFQDPKRAGGQYTYAKAFDAFAPLGPRLIHPSKFTPFSPTTITTRVNGIVMQHSPLDFIYPVDELISYLSQGEPLRASSKWI